ncbi:hypothetical protein [Zavarzinella formosa]|uniref:hypothetical protein n=1 Tax=Zavarzinella formosa TaxID=360055 RepID=UPI00031813FF|nr:hypothetical protein [Zavarzinella formosa]
MNESVIDWESRWFDACLVELNNTNRTYAENLEAAGYVFLAIARERDDFYKREVLK